MSFTLKGTTPVPNVFFDIHLQKLKLAELKLLLVIIRQTLGWVDTKTQMRKERDWLSGSQLRQRTGCSRRALGDATIALISYGLIEVSDSDGNILKTAEERKGKMKMFYRFCCGSSNSSCAKNAITCEENAHYPRQNMPTTKENQNKKLEENDGATKALSPNLKLFKKEFEEAGSIEQLLIDKMAIRMNEGVRVILTHDDPNEYKERFLPDYTVSDFEIKSLKVPYSFWMTFYEVILN